MRYRVLLRAQIAAEDRRARSRDALHSLLRPERDPPAPDPLEINRFRLTFLLTERYRSFSEQRQGNPCWHIRPVGNNSIRRRGYAGGSKATRAASGLRHRWSPPSLFARCAALGGTVQ